MKIILIKILFWLLKVDVKCQNLVPFDDLKKIAGEVQAEELKQQMKKEKYDKALSVAEGIPYFKEWLYLNVVNKRNEHIRTLNKVKRQAQLSEMLTFLRIIEEMRLADYRIKQIKK